MKPETHLVLMVVFIVIMALWLFVGIEWSGEGPVYRRVGGGLLPWAATAILGYLFFG